MNVGSGLALLLVYLGTGAVIARLAVDPLRGRSLGRVRFHMALVALVCAIPEFISPVVMGTELVRISSVVEVSLLSNLIAVTALCLAHGLSRGKVLAQLSLEQLPGLSLTAMATLGTAGAVAIDSTEPFETRFGYVASAGLVVAPLLLWRWSSGQLAGDRKRNSRPPLPLRIAAGILASGMVLFLVFAQLDWIDGSSAASDVRWSARYRIRVLAVLAAFPELMVLWRASSSGRNDFGCAILIGGAVTNLAGIALVDLANTQRSVYQLNESGMTIAIALTSSAMLAALGMRLLNEERDVGGQPHSR